MKIELIKEERINGEIWWCIYLDGVYVKSYTNESSANKYYEDLKKRANNGLSRNTIIKSETI